MVKIEREDIEDVSDIQSFDGVLFNATKHTHRTKVRLFGIPLWNFNKKLEVTIPENKDKKNTKVGFKKD